MSMRSLTKDASSFLSVQFTEYIQLVSWLSCLLCCLLAACSNPVEVCTGLPRSRRRTYVRTSIDLRARNRAKEFLCAHAPLNFQKWRIHFGRSR